MEELKPKKELLYAGLAVILYAVITLICVFRHEIWEDEAQVWLLAKYISFTGLFKHLVNEGHPSFFYLLVMPFAKLFSNIIFMQLICWLSSAAAIFCLWRYSPFSSCLKTVITVSAPFLYFYPVIARSYSIIPLLVFLIAIFYNKQNEKPFIYNILLCILTNTHIIMAAFSFLLWLDFVYKNIIKYIKTSEIKKTYIISSIISFFGFIALCLQLIGTTTSNVYINFSTNNIMASALRVTLLYIYNALDAFYIKTHTAYFNSPVMLLFVLLDILLIIFSFAALFKNSRKFFLLFFFSVAFQFAIYVLTYSVLIFPTRIFISYIILLFCFWVSYKKNKFAEITLSLLFGITIFSGVKAYYADMVFDYSGSKKVAQFIKNNYNLNKIKIMTNHPNASAAVNYYLEPELNLYWFATGRQFKYTVWTEELRYGLNSREWLAYIKENKRHDKDHDYFVLISYNPFEDVNSSDVSWDGFDLVYISGETIENYEKFMLFKYKE